MADSISNSEDVIDSRDVIARIAELESEIESAYDEERGESESFPPIIEWMEREDVRGRDDVEELRALKGLGDEADGCADWQHGEALIRDSYFEQYAQETAEDIGAIPDNVSWPCTCIDWKRAARELQMDYTSVEFDGVTYWIRS